MVRSVNTGRGSLGEVFDYRTIVSDGTQELLDPRTVSVGTGNVLYSRIKGGKHLAGFSRPAYHLLCANLEYDEESDRYWIPRRNTPVNILKGS